MRYTPWVVSEHVPDMSTLENMVASPRFAGKTGQDLAIALWGWMVDHELGLFHYFPTREPFTGREVHDPLKVFNGDGFTICHVHAHTLANLGRIAGFQTRIAAIRGHEGAEFFYDGTWHYFDGDLQMFHRLRPPNENVIASREDLYEDPSLVDDQPNPSFPYHLPDRTPEIMRPLYEADPEYLDVLEERIHSMDFRLRPGEEMVRYFHNLGRWVVFPEYPALFRRYRKETGAEGPTERFWPRRQWGNGVLKYAPTISASHADIEQGADSIDGLELTDEALRCTGDRGEAVFAFESPYMYCGIPDPMGRVPGADGTTLHAAFHLPRGSRAKVEFDLERRDQWQTLWSADGTGEDVEADLDFTEFAEGQYRFRLRFVLEGEGASLTALQTTLWFMVSPHSLPALKNAGENHLSFHSNDRYGLPTRTTMIEVNADDLDFLEVVEETENLRLDADTYECLWPGDPSRPWEVIFKLEAPDGGKMSWVSCTGLIQGIKPGETFDGAPSKIEIADDPKGPWTLLGEKPPIEEEHGWHYMHFGHGRFSGEKSAGYVRFSTTRGAKTFRLAGHYIPASVPDPQPLIVEHEWYEVEPDVGRRRKSHRQLIEGDKAEYTVTCQQEPHDERITMRVDSLPKT